MSNTYRKNQCVNGRSVSYKSPHSRKFAKVAKRNTQGKKRAHNKQLINSGSTELSSVDTHCTQKTLIESFGGLGSNYIPHKERVNVPNMKHESSNNVARKTHSFGNNDKFVSPKSLKEELTNALDIISKQGQRWDTQSHYLHAKATLKQIERRGTPSIFKGRSRFQSAKRSQKEHIVADEDCGK